MKKIIAVATLSILALFFVVLPVSAQTVQNNLDGQFLEPQGTGASGVGSLGPTTNPLTLPGGTASTPGTANISDTGVNDTVVNNSGSFQNTGTTQTAKPTNINSVTNGTELVTQNGVNAGTVSVTNPTNPNVNGGFVSLTSIPGLTDSTSADAPDLPTFLNNLYKFCVGAAAVLAVIQLIHAGILYAAVGSVGKKEEAKHLIIMSLAGLALVLSPFLVYSLINPAILNLNQFNTDLTNLNIQTYKQAAQQQAVNLAAEIKIEQKENLMYTDVCTRTGTGTTAKRDCASQVAKCTSLTKPVGQGLAPGTTFASGVVPTARVACTCLYCSTDSERTSFIAAHQNATADSCPDSVGTLAVLCSTVAAGSSN